MKKKYRRKKKDETNVNGNIPSTTTNERENSSEVSV